MVEEGGVKEKSEVSPVEYNRFKTDRKILIFFLFWFILFFVLNMVGAIITGNFRLSFIISPILISLVAAFMFSGVLAYKYHHKRGIIGTNRILKWFAKVALVIGLAFACGMFFLLTQTSILGEPTEVNTLVMIPMFIGLFIGGFFAAYLSFIILLIIGFGMIGFLSALTRSKTPDLLVEITKITPNITESKKKEDRRTYFGYIWLGWAFDIPDVLDTKTLTINPGEPKQKLPWPIFKQAIIWQIFFGIVIVIYISFSPFLLDLMDMMSLFNIASNISTFIPLLVLPWFIYLRLDAKIKGPVKDFKLFDGLKSRMLQTIVAFGTILIIVRIALKHPGFWGVIQSFIGFFMFFFAGILIFTFVYFNYFENDLAEDIVRKYKEIKD
ncbi:MAG: hypothetical protein JSV09_03125 [Thermoplasmata archaeon]|nr:MAG: hypothetical protein JSV09_03125 [Thermoplasmata archaeon]